MEEIKKIALKIIPADYREKFFYSFEGGKMIRPLFMKDVCSHFGKNFYPLREAALGVEILHCSTLLHDDVIDKETERRGKPPFYKEFSLKEAVLYGDYFAFLAMKIFQNVYPSVIKDFTESVESILEGQIMEFGGVKTLEEYMLYAEKKTASLFVLAAKTPCTFFEIKSSEVLGYAREFGTAFQIANDLKGGREEKNSILSFLSRKEAEKLLMERTEHLKSLEKLKLAGALFYSKFL